MNTFLKDPDAKLTYGFDWSDWLALDETISASSWIVPSGLSQSGTEMNATSTAIVLSGGSVETSYIVTNRIVTASGLQEDRSFILKVIER